MPLLLVIDDDPQSVHAVTIAAPQCTILWAGNGVDGLAALEQTRVDLVVLDLHMPHLAGVPTCIRLRELHPTTPVLPWSGAIDPHSRQLLAEHGCCPPVGKQQPFRVLAHAITSALAVAPPAPLIPAATLHLLRHHAQQQHQRSHPVPLAIVHPDRRYGQHLAMLLTQARLGGAMQCASPPPDPAILITMAPLAPALHAAHPLAVLAVAETLGDALALLAADPQGPCPLGLVVEHPTDDARAPAQIALTLPQLADGHSVIPTACTAPFAALDLSPQQQTILTATIANHSTQAIARALAITPRAVQLQLQRIWQQWSPATADDPAATAHAALTAWWFATHYPR